jgi:alpha-tubulin suppressor-like RCC1 family protein
MMPMESCRWNNVVENIGFSFLLFSFYKKKSMTDIRNVLFSLLARDRSLYTYQLPEEIVHLVLNYTIGTAYVFGNNDNSQLGLSSLSDQTVPRKLNLNVQKLSFGNAHTLLLTVDGQCYISGSNENNQFGINKQEETYLLEKYPNVFVPYINEDINYPVAKEFINLSRLKHQQLQNQVIIKIAAGYNHSLILTNQHRCYSFGENTSGELGIGNKEESNQWNLIADDIIDIGCGTNHSCYLTSLGQLYFSGRLTHGMDDLNTMTLVPGFSNITQIFTSLFNIAFISDGYLYVFGRNSVHQLGFSDTTSIYQPRLALDEFDSPITNVQKVCFGAQHMLILANNQLYVCGSNNSGQLGMGDVKQVDRPRLHEQFLNHEVTDIATCYRSSYIIANKICYATGSNVTGQLGLGHDNRISLFVSLPLFTPEFVKSYNDVSVYAGIHSAGLIII